MPASTILVIDADAASAQQIAKALSGVGYTVTLSPDPGDAFPKIPEHQLVNSKKQEWGIPVRIAMPDAGKLQLRPGELVVLNYWDEEK